LDLIYSPSKPVTEPVILNLPKSGIRLRFDGPEQRLRLIEIIDFSRSKLTYKNIEIAKPAGSTSPVLSGGEDLSLGPSFKHVYSRSFGPSFPGEYLPPDGNDDGKYGLYGLYVLSYPGIAFSFPMLHSTWSPTKDYATLLALSSTKPATSMAIFSGESWLEARKTLYTQKLEDPRSFIPLNKGKDVYPDEIGTVNIFGEGKLRMDRLWNGTYFWLLLGQTTPQELVAELGPPDAIYRKSDQRMLIHKARAGSESQQTRPNLEPGMQDDSTDTDQSSVQTGTDASEDESDEGSVDGKMSKECFYNYFYHGFDILISSPAKPSRPPPSALSNPTSKDQEPQSLIIGTSSPLVATKIIIHSNVPGSYPFNRHRRCRWQIAYLAQTRSAPAATSETPFSEVAKRLHEEWKSIYASPEEAKQRQRGMILNRGWGDSPGSSCELLGDWEESVGESRDDGAVPSILDEQNGLGNTTLYGFPGLVFEVLKNGSVSGLTVF